MAPHGVLVFRFQATSPAAAGSFSRATVSYEGDDVYRFEGDAQGNAVSLDFLSRAAMAQFLVSMLDEEHSVEFATLEPGFSVKYLTDFSYRAIMQNLLMLRDAD